MNDDIPVSQTKAAVDATSPANARTDDSTGSTDLSKDPEADYFEFKPMTHAAASTETGGKDPVRMLLLLLAVAAVISVAIGVSTGNKLSDATYFTARGLIPGLIAVFTSPRTDFGWLNKYWIATRTLLFALTFILIFPVGVNHYQIREAVAIYGAVMAAFLVLEYFYRRSR